MSNYTYIRSRSRSSSLASNMPKSAANWSKSLPSLLVYNSLLSIVIYLSHHANPASDFRVVRRTAWDLEIKSISSRHVETTTDFTCVTCHKVRLICPEGLKRCFDGIVSSRNSLLIVFSAISRMVLFLRQFAMKTVDDVVESIEKDLLLRWLSTKSTACISLVANHPSFDRHSSQNNFQIQSWPNAYRSSTVNRRNHL